MVKINKNIIFFIMFIFNLNTNQIFSSQLNSSFHEKSNETMGKKDTPFYFDTDQIEDETSLNYDSDQDNIKKMNKNQTPFDFNKTEIDYDPIQIQSDINKQDDLGKTLLHKAFENEDYNLVRFLLSNNAKSNLKDKDDRTALHFFAKNPFKKPNDPNLTSLINKYTLDYLLKNGANINDQDNLGLTPLHLAVISNNTNIAFLLINKNADVNIPDKKGNTILSDALLFKYPNQEKLIELLIQKTNTNKQEKKATPKQTRKGNFLKRRTYRL